MRETAGTTRSSRSALRPSRAFTAAGELAVPTTIATACAQNGSVVRMSIAPVPRRRYARQISLPSPRSLRRKWWRTTTARWSAKRMSAVKTRPTTMSARAKPFGL